MSVDLRLFLPNRISGQIVILIVASLIVIHIVLSAAFFFGRPEPPPHLSDRLATLVELIGATPAAARPGVATAVAQAFPQFDLTLAAPTVSDTAADNPRGPDLAIFMHRLGSRYRVMARKTDGPADAAAGLAIAVRLPDGQFVTARLMQMASPPFGPFLGPFEITLFAITISVTVLGLWAARGLTGPLRRFAWAAENFDPDGEIAQLPERGPYEIRTAARALNRMRERIKSLIEDRTRMLAAVSHDLRTPITRLRLRCEFIGDQTARGQMLDELAHMEIMVESVLHFLRDGHARAEKVSVDLATSLQTICDQFADTGRDVSYDGPDHAVIRGHPDELQRAITNLVDNAVRHGGKARVRLSRAATTVTVAVEDEGPGIQGAAKEAVFEPFVRGDAARGMNGGTGFGLGLSIARAVIEAHSGTLTLHDRDPQGLVAQVILPHGDASVATANGGGTR
jgi:signal transduction histidine kinase